MLYFLPFRGSAWAMSTSAGAKIAINWPRVFARCRPEVHKKILDARSRHEELRRLIMEVKGSTPTVDFEAYKKALPISAHPFVQELEAKAKVFRVKTIETAPLIEALNVERTEKVLFVHPYWPERLQLCLSVDDRSKQVPSDS